MIKKILLTLLLITSLLAPTATLSTVGAVTVSPGCGQGSHAGSPEICGPLTSSGGNPIINIIKDVIDVISLIVGVASVIVIIISALSMILAGGDSQQVANARTKLIYALSGIAVVILAQSLVVFVLNNIK